MRHLFSSEKKKVLRLKMAAVFSEETRMLSGELQEILFEDLVTAFESRLRVLNGAQLETYVNLLSVLAARGPLELMRIKCRPNIDCFTLSGYLAFLVQRGVVEERKDESNRMVYAITLRGQKVLKFFGKQKQPWLMTEEELKELSPLF